MNEEGKIERVIYKNNMHKEITKELIEIVGLPLDQMSYTEEQIGLIKLCAHEDIIDWETEV